MTLIKSISGIRGTIGGKPFENLTPVDTVIYISAFAGWLKSNIDSIQPKVVVGRDARISGPMIQSLVNQTLVGCGIEVIDLDLSTTPTVEISVIELKAQAGIIISASHNPKDWNALKFFDGNGEILGAKSGGEILKIAEDRDFNYSSVDNLGKVICLDGMIERHVAKILELSLVNVNAIREKGYKVVVDAVNSTGGIAVPMLLDSLGVEVVKLYCEPTGLFPHNPEPLKEHLSVLSQQVVKEKADFGIVVDPDVDRLAFVDETGEMFGEEYTLVSCADYVLTHTPGNTVSNLSSTRALADVTRSKGGQYFASAVGELNVVEKMKTENAVIGGEGNGGIIYPELHYGRDALVGIALFLSLLTEKEIKVSNLKASYPEYTMSKAKVVLSPDVDVDRLLQLMEDKYKDKNPINIDGIKIEFESAWVHLRKSNTEPIIRVYAEAHNEEAAQSLTNKFIKEIKGFY